jgi:hypothetical protein
MRLEVLAALLLEIQDYDMYAVPTGKQLSNRHVTIFTLTNLKSINISSYSVKRKERVDIKYGASC